MLSLSCRGTRTDEWFPKIALVMIVVLLMGRTGPSRASAPTDTSSMRSCCLHGLVVLAPAATDLRVVVGKGGESTALEPASQADQERGPPGAAVMHELDRFPPVRVCEQQHCLSAAVFQVEGDSRADPFRGAFDAAPLHAVVRRQLHDLHDGTGLWAAEEE